MDAVYHVECVQRRESSVPLADLLQAVLQHLCAQLQTAIAGTTLTDLTAEPFLAANIEEIYFAPLADGAARQVRVSGEEQTDRGRESGRRGGFCGNLFEFFYAFY